MGSVSGEHPCPELLQWMRMYLQSPLVRRKYQHLAFVGALSGPVPLKFLMWCCVHLTRLLCRLWYLSKTAGDTPGLGDLGIAVINLYTHIFSVLVVPAIYDA